MKRRADAIDILILIGVTLFAASIVFPFLYIFSASMSDPKAIYQGRVWIFPVDFNVTAYSSLLEMGELWVGYANALFYTVVGAFVQVTVTVSAAYAISRRRLVGRNLLAWIAALVLWLKPGIIATFLNFRDLGLINTRTGIIIGFACSPFYFLIMRSYIYSVPDSMEESAKIDGANDITIFLRIMVPLLVPGIATIALFYAVMRWNGFFWPMILLRDIEKVPLQVFLRKFVVEMMPPEDYIDFEQGQQGRVSRETVTYATMCVSVVPMLIAYPYIQRYFVKGIMVGAIKG